MTIKTATATDMFNPATGGGTMKDDSFGDPWPGADPTPGSGVAGVVAGYETIKSSMDETKTVTILRLSHAITLDVHPGTPGGALTIIGDMGIVVGAALRQRVSPSALPVGSFVALRFTGIDAEKRNMRTYDVFDVDKAYLGRLHAAAKGTPVPVARVAKPAPKPAPKPVAPLEGFPEAHDGDDDLPF